MEPIFNTINLILGRRGTGKTVYVTGHPEVDQESLFDIYLEKEMKVLLLDTFAHPAYKDVKIISPEQITTRWKRGVYRCIAPPHQMEKVLERVYGEFWNGALINEDLYKTQKKKLTPNMANILGDTKNRNVDWFGMYHTWKFVPLDLYRYVDYIELFKTKSAPGNREEEELADNFDKVMEAYNRVKANESRFYHESVNVEQ